MRTAPPMLAPLFRSDGQARLLAALFLADEQELSIQDLAEGARLSYATAHREVERLLEAGLLASRRVGNVRLVRPNEDSPIAEPVRQILLAAMGPAPLLAAKLAEVPGVDSAFLFGSFAARMTGVRGVAPADIDVMVVGTPDAASVYDICGEVSDSVGREVNPTILSPEEAAEESGFLVHVRANPIVMLIGERRPR